MRSIRISNGMYSALKIEQVSFALSLKRLDRDGANVQGEIPDIGGSNFECAIGDCVQFEWVITNNQGISLMQCCNNFIL